jgi:predicted nucleic acid-binding OB-fold protein
MRTRETLKEVILLLVQLANNEGTKVHALAKILIEISNIKANLFKTMNTVVDIQDYLDYPTLTKTVEVPLAVDLTLDKETQDFVDFFKESKGKITYEDWDGTNSLHDNMLDLMQMATMLRAILYQRTEQE